MGRPDFTVLRTGFIEDFDVHLQEFYRNVIGTEIAFKFKEYAAEIHGIQEEMVQHYRKDIKEKAAIDLRFHTRKRRCAYILRNSPLNSSSVAYHFSELLYQNQRILMTPFKERQLNLCCLGAGPIPEVVGIIKVLGVLYSTTGNPERLVLKVTVVDIEENWKTTSENVLNILSEDRTFAGVDRISIDFNFIQADMTKPFDEDLKDVINKAHFVTMVYFLSTINGKEDTEEGFQMVKEIMKSMKTDNVLFFLNNATDVHFQQMDKAAKEWGDMEIIYEPCVEEWRYLTPRSVQKFLEIYEGDFKLRDCKTNGFMSYCAWRKNDQILERDEVKEYKRQKMLESQKNNEELTIQMKCYRRKMYDLSRKIRQLSQKGKTKNNYEPSLETRDSNQEGEKADETLLEKKIKHTSEDCPEMNSNINKFVGKEKPLVEGRILKEDKRSLEMRVKNIHERDKIEESTSIKKINSEIKNDQSIEKEIVDDKQQESESQNKGNCEELICKNDGSIENKKTQEEVRVHEDDQRFLEIEVKETQKTGKIEDSTSIKYINSKDSEESVVADEQRQENANPDLENCVSIDESKRSVIEETRSKTISENIPKIPREPLLKPRKRLGKDSKLTETDDTEKLYTNGECKDASPSAKQTMQRESDRTLLQKTTEIQGKNIEFLKSLEVKPLNQIEINSDEKSRIDGLNNYSVGETTLSEKTEGIKKRKVIIPLKKPRPRKGNVSNSHLEHENDELNSNKMF